MSSTAKERYTYDQYLELERTSETKHEYLDGLIVAMAGGTRVHGYLIGAVAGELRIALRGKPCRFYSSESRLRLPETGLATYPDGFVVCGDVEPHPDDVEATVNPSLVVEVLSTTTESYDRGEKFQHYRTLPSLQTYMLVNQQQDLIEVWQRGVDGDWNVRFASAGSSIEIGWLGITLQVDAIYDGVQELRELVADDERVEAGTAEEAGA